MSGAILATRNEEVGKINDAIADRFPREAYELKGADSVSRDEGAGLYRAEFLNIIEVSGTPPRRLRLKLGMPVMILRNLNAANGMCNGSNAIVRIHPRCFEVEIFPEKKSGKREFSPRLPLQAPDSGLPFNLARYQFPHSAILLKLLPTKARARPSSASGYTCLKVYSPTGNCTWRWAGRRRGLKCTCSFHTLTAAP